VRVHEFQGRQGLAIRTADAFFARFPADALAPSVALSRGRLLVADGQWGAAWASLETARTRGAPEIAAEAHFWLGESLRLRGRHEAAIAVYLGANILYPDTSWASRGLQGAAQSYLARNMPSEAATLLRQLAEQPNAEPALVRWAREALTHIEAKPPAEPRGNVSGTTTRPRKVVR
jgi:tetratricopeptide (TPR) repeat protein